MNAIQADVYLRDGHDETIDRSDPFCFVFNGPATLWSGAPSKARAVQCPIGINLGISGTRLPIHVNEFWPAGASQMTFDVLYQDQTTPGAIEVTLFEFAGGPDKALDARPWLRIRRSSTSGFIFACRALGVANTKRVSLGVSLGTLGTNRWVDIRLRFYGIGTRTAAPTGVVPWFKVYADVGDGSGFVEKADSLTYYPASVTDEAGTPRTEDGWQYSLGAEVDWIRSTAPSTSTASAAAPGFRADAYGRVRGWSAGSLIWEHYFFPGVVGRYYNWPVVSTVVYSQTHGSFSLSGSAATRQTYWSRVSVPLEFSLSGSILDARVRSINAARGDEYPSVLVHETLLAPKRYVAGQALGTDIVVNVRRSPSTGRPR